MSNEINAEIENKQELIPEIDIEKEQAVDLQENQEVEAKVEEQEEINTSVEQNNNELNVELKVRETIEPSTNDYNRLVNKPQINSVELIGNKSLDELDIQVKGDYPDMPLSNNEIEELLNNFA